VGGTSNGRDARHDIQIFYLGVCVRGSRVHSVTPHPCLKAEGEISPDESSIRLLYLLDAESAEGDGTDCDHVQNEPPPVHCRSLPNSQKEKTEET